MAGESALATGLGLRGDARIKIPGWKALDTVEEQRASLAGNIANLPLAEELTGKANLFNFEQIMGMFRKAIPGFDEKMKLSADLLQAGLEGKVSEGVRRETALYAASKAMTSGIAGSGAHRNLELRDAMRDSLEATQRSLDSFTRWTESIGRLTQPGLMNIGASFISPQQRIAQTNYDKENIWKVQLMKNIEKAKPSNWEKAGAQALDYIAYLGQSVTEAYLGKLTGGMGTPKTGGGGSGFTPAPYGGGSSYGGG